MNKRLIISLSVIGLVAAIAIGGTVAFFSDTETSTGNTFTAGELDLTIDNTSYYNGELNSGTTWAYQDPIGLFFDFHDLKPGDWGEDTISVHVDTNDAWACMDFYLYNADDNGLTEPEAEVDTTDGPGRGELQDAINFIWWKDDGDNVLEDDEPLYQQTVVSLAQLNTFSVPLADSTGDGLLNAGALVGGGDYYIGKAWCFGQLTLIPVPQGQGNNPTVNPGFTCDGTVLNNLTQSDGVQGTLSFRAVQARNNGQFTCESLCSTISFLNEDSFEGVDSPTGWSTSDSEVNLGTNTWSLLGDSADVNGYTNNDPYNLTHRGTRGLGVAGGENDEVDAPEKIEIVFDSPVLVNAFQVRSLFFNETGGVDEEGDVDLYNGGTLVASYHLTATQAGGNGILETFGTDDPVNKIIFYVKGGQSYTSYSEFAVAKARVCPVPVQ